MNIRCVSFDAFPGDLLVGNIAVDDCILTFEEASNVACSIGIRIGCRKRISG